MTGLLTEHGGWLIPLLIFLARIADVSIGTMRIIFLSRGMRLLAPLCGFVEVLIWLLALSQIMQNLTSWQNYFAYALGYAAGNYIGLIIEDKLAMGLLSLWVVTKEDALDMLERLRKAGFGLTRVAARGLQGDVRIAVLVIRRKNLDKVIAIVRETHPEAFVTVNDVRAVRGGFFATAPPRATRFRGLRLWRVRKGR
ncbi:MAG TPA: DUF2179 domain-containing protein [Candidatus Hydrogenedentes bacterium]|nr:DUF2179 domain-containing protein [Candidatus Hydrogenedentota bacterium]